MVRKADQQPSTVQKTYNYLIYNDFLKKAGAQQATKKIEAG